MQIIRIISRPWPKTNKTNNKKSKLKRLLYQGWIRRHEMKCGKQAIPCYTLGLSGCRMPGIEDYWIGWDVPDVTLCIYTFVSIH